MEVPGIEPGASCMLSTRSTTELHPLAYLCSFLMQITQAFSNINNFLNKDAKLFHLT